MANAMQSIRAHAPGRIRLVLLSAGLTTVLWSLAAQYPFTYGQCLRWAADKPTSQGVYVASRICIGMLRRERAAAAQQ